MEKIRLPPARPQLHARAASGYSKGRRSPRQKDRPGPLTDPPETEGWNEWSEGEPFWLLSKACSVLAFSVNLGFGLASLLF